MPNVNVFHIDRANKLSVAVRAKLRRSISPSEFARRLGTECGWVGSGGRLDEKADRGQIAAGIVYVVLSTTVLTVSVCLHARLYERTNER